jgi:hypothetical protein
MASRHVDQTAADFGADQVDATVSGPGDTDGGVPWAPSGPHADSEAAATEASATPGVREARTK